MNGKTAAIENTKSEIDELFKQLHYGSIIISKSKQIESNEQCSRFILRKETSNGQKRMIHELIDENNVHHTNSNNITHHSTLFYSQLLGEETVDVNLMNMFIERLPTLNESSACLCDGPYVS